MKKETYIKMTTFFKERQKLTKLLTLLYSGLPIVMFIAYPTIVLLRFLGGIDHGLILAVVVPLVTLVGTSVMRKIINRQRPYEKFGTASVIKKDKVGKSFPSNHAACGFVIAMTGFCVNPIFAFVLLAVAFAIALTRIFAGVHFISDVLAGSLIGILAGLAFLFI